MFTLNFDEISMIGGGGDLTEMARQLGGMIGNGMNSAGTGAGTTQAQAVAAAM